jgi:hypothetical protein
MFVFASLALHWLECEYPAILALRFIINISVWMFRIWCLELISWLNVKFCLDAQSVELHLADGQNVGQAPPTSQIEKIF